MRKLFLAILPLLTVSVYAQNFSKEEVARWQQQAMQVTIIRDTCGVPHIYGKTDPDCVFGLAYAQAEDNMAQVEDNFIRAIGKGAAVHGKVSAVADQLVLAFEFVRIAKEEYRGAPVFMRAIYDAYAAGLNYYLYNNNGYKKAFLKRIEPWHTLAMVRYFYYVHDILPSVGVSNEDLQKHFTLDPATNTTGSNAWAIGRTKTKNNSAMLFLNPHRQVFGNGTFTEVHVESNSGWRFSGTTKFGFPIPYMGHNGKVSYGYTVNYPDLGDQYIETFDQPGDPMQYKYGNGYRKATRWNDTMLVKEGGVLVTQVVSFLKTHHGPVIKTENGKPVSVRLSNIEKNGWYEQWYLMSKAADLRSFKQAIAPLAFPYFNVVYADAGGNIYYLYYVASAKRNNGYDWKKPLDGSDPRTEWMGIHKLEELPQLTNPASGYIQSCNSDISYTSGAGSIKKELYPSYMIGAELNNHRARRSQAILSENKQVDFKEWSEMTMDVKVQLADDSLDFILKELSGALQKGNADTDLEPLVTVLATWDRLADTNSIGMSLFRELMNQHRGLQLPFVPALRKAKEYLEQVYGTWQVPWGNRMRLQKNDWNATENFSDAKLSYPLGGFSQAYGTIFCISPKGLPISKDGRKKMYHIVGSSYTMIVEMGKKVRAGSVMPFGQQESGPHSEDQAPLFSARKYKEAWFYKEDVLQHAERTYHPGK